MAGDGINHCRCGKVVSFWSCALSAGFCSDECYWAARGDAGIPEGPAGAPVKKQCVPVECDK